MATYLRTPSVERLPVILEELHTGSLRIPPFQRDFEWLGEQRRNLFDSIYKGLPTGSLMVWRTILPLKKTEPWLGPYRADPKELELGGVSQYLLDGLQRMTTLYAALAPSFWTREGGAAPQQSMSTAPDGTPWDVVFELDSQEFQLADASRLEPSRSEDEGPCLPLRVILDDGAFDDWRAAARLNRDQMNRARSLRSAFVDYLIPVVPLATDDIGVVTLTFKRVNSGGTKMGDADMTHALSWNEGYDLREKLEAVREALRPRGWGEIEEETLVRAIAGIALRDPTTMDVEALAKEIAKKEGLVESAGERLVAAVDLFGERLGIRGPSTLPAVQILLFAARAFDLAGGELTEHQREALVTWAAEACIDERFSNTAAHMLRAYFNALHRRLFEPPAAPKPAPKSRTSHECWKFRMIWARSKATALVLAAQGPTDHLGVRLSDPEGLIASGSDNLGMLLARGAEGLPSMVQLRVRAPRGGVGLQSPANRFVCPPAGMAALRGALLSNDCPPPVLETHLVDAGAHAALLRGDLDAFFEARRRTIVDAETRWARERGAEVEIALDARTYAQG